MTCVWEGEPEDFAKEELTFLVPGQLEQTGPIGTSHLRGPESRAVVTWFGYLLIKFTEWGYCWELNAFGALSTSLIAKRSARLSEISIESMPLQDLLIARLCIPPGCCWEVHLLTCIFYTRHTAEDNTPSTLLLYTNPVNWDAYIWPHLTIL